MSHGKQASYTRGSTYYETLVAYFLLKKQMKFVSMVPTYLNLTYKYVITRIIVELAIT